MSVVDHMFDRERRYLCPRSRSSICPKYRSQRLSSRHPERDSYAPPIISGGCKTNPTAFSVIYESSPTVWDCAIAQNGCTLLPEHSACSVSSGAWTTPFRPFGICENDQLAVN